MSNNYTQFAAIIDDVTQEEAAWASKVLEEPREDDLSPEASLYRKITADAGGSLGFTMEAAGFGEHVSIVLSAEDCGDVEQVATFAQEFLRKFRPGGHFGLEWAETCSRPCVGEFGGGAVFVTETDMVWLRTGAWLRKQAASHE